jgi:soluble lytic murein transglycosylase-like protein
MKRKCDTSKFICGLGLRAALAIFIVGLSAASAKLEHQARLELDQVPAPAAKTAPVPAPEPANLTVGLAPNFYILERIKDQTRQKPLFDKKSTTYDQMIEKAARMHRISPALVKAVIQAESKFDSRAVSAQGAVGLMQILPSTARSVGVSRPQEPYANITAGARYLKSLLDEFGNDEYLAVAAYNCGPEVIKRYGGHMPPFSETRTFVNQVMRYYQSHIES